VKTDNRITVNLGVKAAAALERSMDRGGEGKTGVVETALVRNDFFEEVIESGRGILIENSNGELERIHLL
jgi:hypothetical protein